MSTPPKGKGTQLTLHPLLLYSQHDLLPGICTALLWDVRDPPDAFACPTGAPQCPLHAHDLMQFATTPPLKTLRITCGVLPYQHHYKPPQPDGQQPQVHPHDEDGPSQRAPTHPTPRDAVHPAHRRVHSNDSSDSQPHYAPHPDNTDKWAIEAHNPLGVTLLDVLTALYEALQTPLTHDEWDALSPKQQARVSAAFDARWRAAGSTSGSSSGSGSGPDSVWSGSGPGSGPVSMSGSWSGPGYGACGEEEVELWGEAQEVVRRRGIVRADCLLRHTLFAGLTVSLVELKSCVLTVRRPQLLQASP